MRIFHSQLYILVRCTMCAFAPLWLYGWRLRASFSHCFMWHIYSMNSSVPTALWNMRNLDSFNLILTQSPISKLPPSPASGKEHSVFGLNFLTFYTGRKKCAIPLPVTCLFHLTLCPIHFSVWTEFHPYSGGMLHCATCPIYPLGDRHLGSLLWTVLLGGRSYLIK